MGQNCIWQHAKYKALPDLTKLDQNDASIVGTRCVDGRGVSAIFALETSTALGGHENVSCTVRNGRCYPSVGVDLVVPIGMAAMEWPASVRTLRMSTRVITFYMYPRHVQK